MKHKKINLIKKYVFSTGLALFLISQSVNADASVYYEKSYKEIVSNGITYEKSLQITSSGLIDVNVLYIDMTNPNIYLSPIQSAANYGAVETISAMALESGAVAGINADFFDMGANPATSFGDMVIDGKIISADEEREGFATFFTDENGKSVIEYIDRDIKFLNNGANNIKVHAMNKYFGNFSAVYFDRNAIVSTASLDAKFPDLVKFVVTNGVITYISKGSETVSVPENGYIILCAATYAQYFYDSVKVGDKAELIIESRFDYGKMQTAIGGAGKILENGNYSNYGYVVSPTQRQPRSAIGISQDGTKVILAVVDGRGASVGATHEEMAEIMKNLGAWNAMHFDGGGSSTMVADTNKTDSLQVKNTPSGGAQRKVVNGLGVFDSSPVGEAVKLQMNVSEEKVFMGNSVNVTAVGLDANSKKTELNKENIQLYSNTDGVWIGNSFYPSKTGNISIYAVYNGFIEEKIIECMELSELVPNKKSIRLLEGNSVLLSFEGISTKGETAPIENVSLEVIPAELGTISPEGLFIPGIAETGLIKASVGSTVCYIDVAIGTRTQWEASFNNTAEPIKFLPSNDKITGKVSYEDSVNKPGNTALALTYAFEASSSTQAAYLEFENPVMFEENLGAFQISVFGHGKGGWVRGRIVDASGHEHVVDIVKDVNFNGWGRFSVDIPEDAVQPVSLQRLYVANLSNTDTAAKTLYFDDLAGVYAIEFNPVDKPASSVYVNPYQGGISINDKIANSVDLTFVGDIIIDKKEDQKENYKALQLSALTKFAKNTDIAYFVGPSDLEDIKQVSEKAVKRDSGYKFTQTDNYAIIEMSAIKGTLSSTLPENWRFFEDGINSKVEHIIIVTDKRPANYSTSQEYELFREALVRIKNSGKNVFVVSTQGFESGATILDGVNYINLGALFNNDSSINENFKTLRIRISGSSIYYDLHGAE